MATPQAGRRVYFYGVVAGAHEGPIPGLTPIDGEGEVYGLAHDDLTVVVSDTHKERYEVTRRHIMAHEAVVSGLIKEYQLLPARFGSVRPLDLIVEELLVAFHPQLANHLGRLSGHLEVALKVNWAQFQPIVAEAVAADPWLQSARKRLATSRTSQNVRLDVGKRLEQALALKREQEAAALVEGLRELIKIDEVKRNEDPNESTVLNASFLLESGLVDDFTTAVQTYDSRWEGRYDMTLGNPAAPYAFVPQLEAIISRHERRRERARR
ncbi:MAG: GvpL/GvpF family gas vesicle protein [Candidatus Nanopelagicales bacterium]